MDYSIQGKKGLYYITNRKLGSGAISEVYYGEKQNKEKVAIKIVKKEQYAEKKQNLYYQNELEVSKFLASQKYVQENICQIYDVVEYQDQFFVIMEYCQGGDLLDYIMKQKQEDINKNILDIALEIVKGVSYLHCNGIVHRDLKPENIYLQKKRVLTHFNHYQEIYIFKIGDFGLSKFLKYNTNSVVGTINYMAPELLEGNYGREIDIWSIGCILHELKTQKQLFWSQKMDLREIIFQIKKFYCYESSDSNIDQLIKLCMDQNSQNRIKIDKLQVKIEKMKDNLEYEFVGDDSYQDISSIRMNLLQRTLLKSSIAQIVQNETMNISANQNEIFTNQQDLQVTQEYQKQNMSHYKQEDNETVSFHQTLSQKAIDDKLFSSDQENTGDYFTYKFDQVLASRVRDSQLYEKQEDILTQSKQFKNNQDEERKNKIIQSFEQKFLQSLLKNQNYQNEIKEINELLDQININYLIQYLLKKVDGIIKSTQKSPDFHQKQQQRSFQNQINPGIIKIQNFYEEFTFKNIDQSQLQYKIKQTVQYSPDSQNIYTQKNQSYKSTKGSQQNISQSKIIQLSLNQSSIAKKNPSKILYENKFTKYRDFDLNQKSLSNVSTHGSDGSGEDQLNNLALRYNIFIQLIINQIYDTINLQSFLIYLVFCTISQNTNQQLPEQSRIRYQEKYEFTQKNYPFSSVIFLIMLIKILQTLSSQPSNNSRIKSVNQDIVQKEVIYLFKMLIKEKETQQNLVEFIDDYFQLSQSEKDKSRYTFFDQTIIQLDSLQSKQILEEDPLKTVYFYIDTDKKQGNILLSLTQYSKFYPQSSSEFRKDKQKSKVQLQI
ncbi:hypothetical protein ABPG74_016521 [Tetrahymena malaccensis]